MFKFCSGALAKIKALFKKFDEYAKAHVDTALTITGAIKNALNSPYAKLLTDIIPGDLDEMIRQKALAALDKSIAALAIAKKCNDFKDLGQRVTCYINELKTLTPELQQALLFKMASNITSDLDGNRYKTSEYDAFVQGRYTTTK